MNETKQPGLNIGQIFLYKALFEHRKDALQQSPKTDIGELEVSLSARILGQEDDSAGLILVTVKTKDEDEGLYRFHVEMAAIVAEQEETKNLGVREYLTKNGFALIYPFLREAVANITGRGRFGPLWLKPFNFKAAFDETEKETQEPEEGEASGNEPE